MNSIPRFMMIFSLLFLFFIVSPGAVELTMESHIQNLTFPPTGYPSQTTFTGASYPFGFSLNAKDKLTDQITIQGGFIQDDVMKNTAIARFKYEGQYFSLTGGPFFGVFNTPATYLKPGLSLAAEIGLPGIIFLEARADTSIGVRMVEVGDYIQERNEIALGYYIPNAICRFVLSTKKYVENKEKWEQVDSVEEYFFETDIFKKNVPYRIILSLGYQSRSRQFIDSDETVRFTMGTVLLGSRFDYRLNESFSFFADLDSNIYSFPLHDLEKIQLASPAYLFALSLGVTINTTSLFDPKDSEVIIAD